MALALVSSLFHLWFNRSYISEGRHELQAVLRISEGIDSTDRARALYSLGRLVEVEDDYAAAGPHYQASLEVARRLEGSYEDKKVLGDTLIGLSIATSIDDLGLARQYAEEALTMWRELKNKGGIALSLNQLGNVAFGEEDYALARQYWQEGLELARELERVSTMALLCNNLGEAARAQGDLAAARSFYQEALAVSRAAGIKSTVALCLFNLGYVALAEGDYRQALTYLRESLDIYRERNERGTVADCLTGASEVWSAQGYAEKAARLSGAAEALGAVVGHSLGYLEQVEHARSLATSRSALGEKAFEAARREGAAMSFDEAVAYAFEREP
jgi:tetratricopeptide (TPR) repeat protein